jgi:hypothetical protein
MGIVAASASRGQRSLSDATAGAPGCSRRQRSHRANVGQRPVSTVPLSQSLEASAAGICLSVVAQCDIRRSGQSSRREVWAGLSRIEQVRSQRRGSRFRFLDESV